MKQALGMIETKGLIAAIEAGDVMLKTAEVQLVSKEKVGGGLTMITIAGDVGAVKTAVDAGASAVRYLGENQLFSSHVIARPAEDLDHLIEDKAKEQAVPRMESSEEIVETLEPVKEIDAILIEVADHLDEESKKDLIEESEMIQQLKNGQSQPLRNHLMNLKVAELREMAKSHSDFTISRKDLYRTSKENLIEAFIDYFNE